MCSQPGRQTSSGQTSSYKQPPRHLDPRGGTHADQVSTAALGARDLTRAGHRSSGRRLGRASRRGRGVKFRRCRAWGFQGLNYRRGRCRRGRRRALGGLAAGRLVGRLRPDMALSAESAVSGCALPWPQRSGHPPEGWCEESPRRSSDRPCACGTHRWEPFAGSSGETLLRLARPVATPATPPADRW